MIPSGRRPATAARRSPAARARSPAPATVDLVHEQQRRDAQPLQRAHQDAGLRLHALDGGDHQDGAVQHAQHPLHLGDEVGVARGVDQVDRDVVDGERDDRGLDRDPALLLERQRIGLRRSGIDAADLVDNPGGVQQPLGESRLTGVYMRQDAQVERSLRTSVIPLEVVKPFVMDMNAWRISASPLSHSAPGFYEAQHKSRRAGRQTIFLVADN